MLANFLNICKMKRFVFLLMLAIGFGISAYGQLSVDSAYTTSADDVLITVGSGILGGDSKKVAYEKINAKFDTLSTFYVVDTVVAAID